MTIQIITGDCRNVLKTLPDESVHMVVTSPPYWRLRDYGTAKWKGGEPSCDHKSHRTGSKGMGDEMRQRGEDRGYAKGSNFANYGDRWTDGSVYRNECGKCGAMRVDHQIGLEPSYQDFVAEMVAVFREVRRVLRADGTLWLNLGDSYASTPSGAMRSSGLGGGIVTQQEFHRATSSKCVPDGLKPKDLCGIPWRVAFALQADGWWLRQDIIWSKPNPMPESVTDRCTKAHEYVFLLSKSERYYYDAEAIKEPASYDPTKTKFPDGWDTGPGGHGSFHREGREKGRANDSWKGSTFDGARDLAVRPNTGRGRASGNKTHKGVTEYEASESEEHRTRAGLLKIAETPYAMRNKRSVWTVSTEAFSEAHFATFPPTLIEPCILAGCPKGGTVLDPFGGAGTTGLVADRLQRNAVLIELNPTYAAMAEKRIHNDAPLLAALGG